MCSENSRDEHAVALEAAAVRPGVTGRLRLPHSTTMRRIVPPKQIPTLGIRIAGRNAGGPGPGTCCLRMRQDVRYPKVDTRHPHLNDTCQSSSPGFRNDVRRPDIVAGVPAGSWPTTRNCNISASGQTFRRIAIRIKIRNPR